MNKDNTKAAQCNLVNEKNLKCKKIKENLEKDLEIKRESQQKELKKKQIQMVSSSLVETKIAVQKHKNKVLYQVIHEKKVDIKKYDSNLGKINKQVEKLQLIEEQLMGRISKTQKKQQEAQEDYQKLITKQISIKDVKEDKHSN